MKFQNPSIHPQKISNFTENCKKQSTFQNCVILSKYEVKFSKVNQVIYSSAKINISNMKALAKILLEISCTQDFQILFSTGHNSEKGHNLGMKKKICVNYFFMRNMYIKFQNPSIHGLKVSNFTEKLKK